MSPVPTPDELLTRYEAEHASGKWQALFDEASPRERERRAALLTSLKGTPGLVLDVGFGDGGFLDAAAAEGWETLGVEVSWAAAARAGRGHLRVVGTMDCLRAAPSADAVTFWDVLEHVAEPGDLVERAVALLRPGGIVAVSMPNVLGTESRLRGAGWRYHDLDAYGHLLHAAPGPLAAFLEGRGLEVIHRETSGSADLRDLVGGWGDGRTKRLAQRVLDKASGALARVAIPRGAGNTLLLVAKKPGIGP